MQELIVPFIRSADDDHNSSCVELNKHDLANNHEKKHRTALVERHTPEELASLLNFVLPNQGLGKNGLLEIVAKVLKYSVNTWHQGFMDKLCASTNSVGVVSDLLLSVLNANVYVYNVSPVLTIIEKTTAKTFARLFGFKGPNAGGISTQGGSASNATALVIARNILFPETKGSGNGSRKFVLFTSEQGHYSLQKAAMICGLGTTSLWKVPVDSRAQMRVDELERLILEAISQGKTPFFVNATAGTTVFGAYDPFGPISKICKRYNLWMHVDGSWGGPVILSSKQRWRIAGAEAADSLAVNPHKMMGVPVTCSLLLTPDIRRFHQANSSPAEYLFHNDYMNKEVWDLADLTLQCGRRGDSLKIALGWVYYGEDGYAAQIDEAFAVAAYAAKRVEESRNLALLEAANPPSCLQVCFHYAAEGIISADVSRNTVTTKTIVGRLVTHGFMIDYAPGQHGSFFRMVVNLQTRRKTVDRLLSIIEEIGLKIV